MANVIMYWKDGSSNSVPDFDKSYWEGLGWSTTKPSTNTNTNTNTNNQIPSWNLSTWSSNGNNWGQQPILTINGQQFTFNTPQEYIDKMNSAGITDGQSSTFKQQFQSAQNNWKAPTNNGTTDATINSLYQKYFGRNATTEENNAWAGNAANAEIQLKNDYKLASGIDYDGSPIKPGNQKTDNQLAGAQSTTVNQILNAEAMAKYTPDQYTRNADGTVTLKPGVTPIAGTTKPVSSTPDTNTNTSTPVTPVEISAEDKKWVNDLYQKYFDRTATSSEIANWAKENPQALEQFLGGEQKKLGYVSKAAGAENKARYDAAIAQIDASNLPDDIKSLWKTTVGLYPDATSFDTTEIINTFNKIKNETIDPYYKELADVAIRDTQTLVDASNASRAAELEAQNANAAGAIKTAQGNLESSGMTFSGKGVEQLGTGSAYGDNTTPVQTPFGGIDPTKLQGSVGQNNRLIATSTAAQYKADQNKLGSTLENQLGSDALSKISGLNYSPNGVNLTATNTVNKETKSATTLSNLIDQWRNKQNLKTNV